MYLFVNLRIQFREYISISELRAEFRTANMSLKIEKNQEIKFTPESPSGAIKLLWNFLALEKKDIGVAVVYSLIMGLLYLIVPITAQALFNNVAFGTLIQPVVVLTALALGLLLFSAVFNLLQVYVVEIIQRRIFTRVSMAMGRLLPKLQDELRDEAHPSNWVHRFFEITTIQKAFAYLLVDGLSVAMQMVIGMALLAVYHPLLLAFDLALMALLVLIIFGLGGGAIRASIQESKAKLAVAGWLQEITESPIAFKSMAGSNYAVSRTDDLTAGYIKKRRSHFNILFRQIAGSLGLQALATATLLGVGGYLVIQGQLTLGQLVAAEIVMGAVAAGMSKLGKHLESFYDLVASTDKLGYLFTLPSEDDFIEEKIVSDESTKHSSEQNDGPLLQFRKLKIARLHADQLILQNSNWILQRGVHTALFENDKSSKRALTNSILGLRRPTAGAIEVKGVDLRDWSPFELREKVILIRDIELFPGSILDNITLDRPEVNQAKAREVLERVGLTEDIPQLPDGWRTELTGRYHPLSSSQAWKLVFARALVSEPDLLVIEDALDALDDLTLEQILSAIQVTAETTGMTVFTLTHEPDVADKFTRKLALKDLEG